MNELFQPCKCCGKPAPKHHEIHLICMKKHMDHERGISASRCKEHKNRKSHLEKIRQDKADKLLGR